MTSKTGSTEATLAGTVDPPTVYAAVGGAVVELGVLAYVWSSSTAVGECANPLASACLGDPFARQVAITMCVCLVLWLYSLRTIPATGTSDPSIVDRCWSIFPWCYVWGWYSSAPSPRLLLMAILCTVWGVRLTVNFAIKGGFSGGEDYRWKEIRRWPGFDKGWELFNALFICGFQQFVILAFVSPAAASIGSTAPLNCLDGAATVLYLLLVVGEAVADHQMMTFQTEKYRRLAASEPLGPIYGKGFVHTGLWALSRHPNYFCEVSLWWAFYLFSIAAGHPLVNWTILGPLFLSCLFVLPHASLDVTEVLSSRKYEGYAAYQQRVSRFVPLPPRPADYASLPPLCLGDKCLVCWFAVGIAITFLIDMEQVLITAPDEYGRAGVPAPLWPPPACVHAIHWWGHTADKLVLARPTWFRVAIWLEVCVQAPFYMLAMYAFARQRAWIRLPAIVYSAVLLTIMPIVLGEQFYGPHRTDRPVLVSAVYAAYVLMPILVFLRVLDPNVFPRKAKGAAGKATTAHRAANASRRGSRTSSSVSPTPRTGRRAVSPRPKRNR